MALRCPSRVSGPAYFRCYPLGSQKHIQLSTGCWPRVLDRVLLVPKPVPEEAVRALIRPAAISGPGLLTGCPRHPHCPSGSRVPHRRSSGGCWEKASLPGCLSGRQTAPGAALSTAAAGSQDSSSICLVPKEGARHRPGNHTPRGEPGALSLLFDPSLPQPSLELLGTPSSSWNLCWGLVWGWSLFPSIQGNLIPT